ncbi:hypothetical protein KVR01_009493 [Diaporthe batatas]|uniref:uncharacterized protein n=1 Tax=Diaporthe batatas TaxID=748121 RepID=UPI001D049391|nr:uncharacterized protein KVR01_009493 [Diaporthe batatas]KAG8161229.1 hypothetical protein KVR01_009493 [Diaporthe batatas]
MDPESQAMSSAPPPIIDLPHRWGENGKLLPGTSPAQCPICDWNGDPDSFWGYGRRIAMDELTGRHFRQEPINCASCKLLRCILYKRAEVEGRQATESSYIIGPDFHVVTWLDDEAGRGNHSIFVSSDTPRSDIDRYNISKRFILNSDSLNDRSAGWVQERLAACANSHELCKSQSGDSFMPTRLINLKPGWKGLDVRLEKSSPQAVRPRAPYVALSYCWGGYRPACITTAGTLAENQTRIAWDKLPATFQDAAAFTQSLGIQFLWIDSICIIQEDEDDWQREAGKMNAVYKNSYLTLAALSGGDSNSGLHNISIKQDSHVVAELRIAQNVYPLYMRQAHYLDSLLKSKFMEHHENKSLAYRYPLLSRAWAYQERTISPRVVFFTESEMIFQCLEHVECECGAAQEWSQTQIVHRTHKTSIFMQTESESLKLKGKDRASERFRCDLQTQDGRDWDIARDWRTSVVREYSALKTSMPRDRLPALGAVAEQFKRARMGEAYLAGLWSRSLLDDLLWFRLAQRAPSQESNGELERPFSLPTWSWASLKRNVGYYFADFSFPMAEIIEANCSYLGENEFGILQSSRLVLKGRVLASVVGKGPEGCSFYVPDRDEWARFVDNSQSNLSIRMDMGHEGAYGDPLWQEIYILEISESTWYEDDSPIADWNFLLLHREDHDGLISYTRAGMATFIRQDSEIQTLKFEEPQEGFERVFELQSILTTCLIL